MDEIADRGKLAASYARFVCILLGMIAVILVTMVTALEVFHRYVVIPRVEVSRIHLEQYLARSGDYRYVALGSSQMNMSLNISRDDFYNLAWRGEAASQQYVRLQILLREAKRLPCKIFLEANAPTMIHPGTRNPLFYFREHVRDQDLDVVEESGVPYVGEPLLTQLHSDYRRDLLKLAWKFVRRVPIAADLSSYDLLPNGFSYNTIGRARAFTEAAAANRALPGPATTTVHPNFDFFFRRIIESAQAHGIEVIPVSTPLHSVLRDSLGEAERAANDYIGAVSRQYGLAYFDFSAFSDDPEEFWNEDHMTLAGATRFGRHAGPLLIRSGRACDR